MSNGLSVGPIEARFEHLSRTQFRELVAELRAIVGPVGAKGTAELRTNERTRTISFGGDLFAYGEGLGIVGDLLWALARRHHCPTAERDASGEVLYEEEHWVFVSTEDSPSFSPVQLGQTNTRFVWGENFVDLQRYYVSPAYEDGRPGSAHGSDAELAERLRLEAECIHQLRAELARREEEIARFQELARRRGLDAQALSQPYPTTPPVLTRASDTTP